MAAWLPGGLRLPDHLSVGVIARVYPHEAMFDALHRTGRKSVRRRALPADVMMYYVIAMVLFRRVSTQEVLCPLVYSTETLAVGMPVWGFVRVEGSACISLNAASDCNSSHTSPT